MDESRTSVLSAGLPTVVEVVRQRVAGLEAWRRCDLSCHQRHMKAKTPEQRALERWLQDAGSIIGADVVVESYFEYQMA